MKAVVIHAARDLRVEEREPEAAGSGQVEIAVEAGGICGSDLHYFNHGGFGTVRVREPMILGHEVAGTLINQKRVDLTPLLTGVFGLDEAIRAFEIAGDRSQSMKVQLSF